MRLAAVLAACLSAVALAAPLGEDPMQGVPAAQYQSQGGAVGSLIDKVAPGSNIGGTLQDIPQKLRLDSIDPKSLFEKARQRSTGKQNKE